MSLKSRISPNSVRRDEFLSTLHSPVPCLISIGHGRSSNFVCIDFTCYQLSCSMLDFVSEHPTLLLSDWRLPGEHICCVFGIRRSNNDDRDYANSDRHCGKVKYCIFLFVGPGLGNDVIILSQDRMRHTYLALFLIYLSHTVHPAFRHFSLGNQESSPLFF